VHAGAARRRCMDASLAAGRPEVPPAIAMLC
jgi:hypothetical protein